MHIHPHPQGEILQTHALDATAAFEKSSFLSLQSDFNLCQKKFIVVMGKLWKEISVSCAETPFKLYIFSSMTTAASIDPQISFLNESLH